MSELKTCPFCGGDAEMYTGRNYPAKGKGLCATYEDALAELQKWKSTGVVVKHSIHPRKHFVHGMKAPKQKWSVDVEMQAFIPRCCNPKCLGRTAMMFQTETEATEAWNTRSDIALTATGRK